MKSEKWNKTVDGHIVEKTIHALKENNIEASFVKSGEEARKKVLEIIPKGAEVMNMSSVTLEKIGLVEEINESGNYDSVKNKLKKMDRKTQELEMNRLGAAPEWAVGSVHAVTQDGKVIIASNTGSQLAGYVFGSPHVVWVVGTQKIVKDLDEGMKRLYEYVFPLEDKHMQQLYNVHSNVSKILIVNKEWKAGRIHLIFVGEVLGF